MRYMHAYAWNFKNHYFIIINDKFYILKIIDKLPVFQLFIEKCFWTTELRKYPILHCAVYICEYLVETHNSDEVIMYFQALRRM